MTTRSVRVKAARKLTRRSVRRSERLFLAEGPQALQEALSLPQCVAEVFATIDASDRHRELRRRADSAGVPWHLVDEAGVASLCETVTPQGVVAVCGISEAPLDAVVSLSPHLVAVADDIRDPGNAGALVRCADAAGAAAVVLTGNSVDPYNGKAVRASVGSIFHLPVVTGVDAEDSVSALRASGLAVLATAGAGTLSLDDAVDSALLAQPTVWLFGNEAHGLAPGLLELADEVVRVPIYGRAESLNLATAAAVCLYASARAQRASTG